MAKARVFGQDGATGTALLHTFSLRLLTVQPAQACSGSIPEAADKMASSAEAESAGYLPA